MHIPYAATASISSFLRSHNDIGNFYTIIQCGRKLASAIPTSGMKGNGRLPNQLPSWPLNATVILQEAIYFSTKIFQRIYIFKKKVLQVYLVAVFLTWFIVVQPLYR
jgi:hypothetical protein